MSEVCLTSFHFILHRRKVDKKRLSDNFFEVFFSMDVMTRYAKAVGGKSWGRNYKTGR
ncbi:hypothetical protein SAM19_03605 [Brevibacillus laterosporus]|nr:hypothetical protein [Brevibacillus laterosporus]